MTIPKITKATEDQIKGGMPPEYIIGSLDNIDMLDWVTDKTWVRIDPASGKPHEAAKDNFWRVTSIFATSVGGPNEVDSYVNFHIVKYARNKFQTTEKDGKKIKTNAIVPGFIIAGDRMLKADDDTGRFMRATDFFKQFKTE